MRKYLIICFLALLLVLPAAALAQQETPAPPPTTNPDENPIPLVHTVQEGENLTYIAGLYSVTVAELQLVNNLTDSDVLFVGQTLVIPGGEGEAIATIYTVGVGDTLAGIAAAFNTNVADLMATNNIVYPEFDLRVGQTLAVISRTGSALPRPLTGTPHVVAAGESLLTLSARYGFSPATLAAANDLAYPSYVFPGQRLRIPNDAVPYRELPGEWVDVQLGPLPLVQGQTLSIYAENLLPGRPNGTFAGQPLRFAPEGNGYVALVGLGAFTSPGLYRLELSGSGDRPWAPFRETIEVVSGSYGTQFITVSEELNALLDPAVRANEDAYLATIYTRYREEQDWSGPFQAPLTTTVVTAPYGDGRSYNGGPIEIFHSGVDFAAGVGAPVYAAANGVIAFSGPVELRGNIVIIDHGRGVMTAYFHLSETLVAVQERVEAGQIIATAGSTGLSSGPHLHWDLRIMDVPVNGLQWTTTEFP